MRLLARLLPLLYLLMLFLDYLYVSGVFFLFLTVFLLALLGDPHIKGGFGRASRPKSQVG